MELKYVVNKENKYVNIHQVLKEKFELSDRLIIKLKKEHFIFLNNTPAYVHQSLKTDDIVSVQINFEESSDNILPIKMFLDILYEDDSLLIINKPPFMPVHPSMNHYEDSLSNGVKFYFNSIGLQRKIRPVNRLDKNTSGIVIFAKNQYVQECLVKQMKNNLFKKEYLALVCGKFEDNFLLIDKPIARNPNSIIERCISPDGDSATTIVESQKCFDDFSLLKCTLKTGRTHQIRVHLSHIGYPILGDDLYGSKSNLIDRQALHAYKVSFIHPILKKEIIIECPIPNDMKRIITDI